MLRRFRYPAAGVVSMLLFGLLLVMATGAVQNSDTQFGSAGTPASDRVVTPVATSDPVGTPSQDVPGVPGIQPRTDVQPGQPTYGQAEVEAFLQSRGNMYALDTAEPVIEQIEFLTAGEIAAQTKSPLPRRDEDLFCVVTLSGDFQYGGGLHGVEKPVVHTSKMYFDAMTGNLLRISLVGEGD